MKKLIILAIAFAACTGCDTTPRDSSALEKLHGNWYGIEITNHLINQGVWDTLNTQSISMMTLTLDTANATVIIDSSGVILDTAQLTINNDSSITINSNASNLGWAFDSDLIGPVGQPILDSLRQLFTGEQTFQVLQLTQDEAVFYFDTVIPIQFGSFYASMELRHTQYWQK